MTCHDASRDYNFRACGGLQLDNTKRAVVQSGALCDPTRAATGAETNMDTTKSGNREVVERAVAAAGGIYVLAEKMGISYQAIQKWVRTGIVPPKRVLMLERATRRPGPMVHRSKIRPDLYPRALYPLPRKRVSPADSTPTAATA
jgi:DNA-binding transcriptional regulator YdaS (Cro superfamily)